MTIYTSLRGLTCLLTLDFISVPIDVYNPDFPGEIFRVLKEEEECCDFSIVLDEILSLGLFCDIDYLC
jgi:hypothetical protein